MSNRWMAAALLFALWPSMAAAQEKPAPDPQPTPEPAAAQPREAGPQVPLKVSVVISRDRGEKRVGSLTYVLGLVANGPRTTLRMGSDVPIVQNVISPAGAVRQQSYSYRSIGTNIDCQASTASNGLYRLQVTVADSSVHLDAADKAAVPARVADVPMFRTFNSSFSILLRDGQTTEYTSATDPVTGEVMRIDITLNVLK
jgi:hypothetical protein